MTPEQRKHFEYVRDVMHGDEEKEDKFCDNNCVWTNHHPDCVRAEPEWYHVIDVHGCNRFYHKTEDCPYEFNTPLYTTPPQRKPLTHEQRFDLLTKFEPHKNKWEAPAILIDMVEAAHGITASEAEDSARSKT